VLAVVAVLGFVGFEQARCWPRSEEL